MGSGDFVLWDFVETFHILTNNWSNLTQNKITAPSSVVVDGNVGITRLSETHLSLASAAEGFVRIQSHLCGAKLSCSPRWAWQEFWPWCHPGELDPWWTAGVERAAALGTLPQRLVQPAGRGCGGEGSGSVVRRRQSTLAGWSSAGRPGPSPYRPGSSAPEQGWLWSPGSESRFEPESEEKTYKTNIWLLVFFFLLLCPTLPPPKTSYCLSFSISILLFLFCEW